VHSFPPRRIILLSESASADQTSLICEAFVKYPTDKVPLLCFHKENRGTKQSRSDPSLRSASGVHREEQAKSKSYFIIYFSSVLSVVSFRLGGSAWGGKCIIRVKLFLLQPLYLLKQFLFIYNSLLHKKVYQRLLFNCVS